MQIVFDGYSCWIYVENWARHLFGFRAGYLKTLSVSEAA